MHTKNKTIVVTNANYNVFGDGTISFNLETSTPINTSWYINSTSFHSMSRITPGDVFELTVQGTDCLWKKIGESNVIQGQPILIRELTHCPVCAGPLAQDGIRRYCVNDACLAKIQVNIHRFIFHAGIQLTPLAKQAIDMLIGFMIRHPVDLFKLIDTDFDHLEISLARLKPKDIVNSIKAAKLSIGVFIKSINVPPIIRPDNQFVNLPLIDANIKTIPQLLDWMNQVSIEAANTNSDIYPEPYMSLSVYEALQNYFMYSPNVTGALMLNSMGIFK